MLEQSYYARLENSTHHVNLIKTITNALGKGMLESLRSSAAGLLCRGALIIQIIAVELDLKVSLATAEFWNS